VGFLLDNLKSTIVIGDKGRIVIPVKIREALQLEEGDALTIAVVDGIIMMGTKEEIKMILEDEEK
jgi:AbrB family looped-hinge helix DNA binding protein